MDALTELIEIPQERNVTMSNVKALKQEEVKVTARIPVKQSRLKAVPPKDAEPKKPKILIFGRAGVGKTWASLDFPACFYIDTEGGATRGHYTDKLVKSGGAYLGQEQGSLDFATVLDQVQALATEEHPYKTLIIDSFTKLYSTYAADIAEKLGDDYGRDKKEANKPTRKLLNWLSRIDMNVILIAHEKSLWGVDTQGKRNEIGVTFDAYDKLDYELDLCLNIIKSGPARNARIVKTRLEGFDEGKTFPWSYAEFSNRYGKEVIEKEGKQIILATEEQLKEIEALLKTVRVPEADIKKWLTAAGAEQWNEMETGMLAGTIKYIRKTYNLEGEKA